MFSHNVRLGPDAARVRLRLSQDPLPPVSFFDSGYEADARGIAIDVGGGDRAFRDSGPALLEARSRPLLSVAGEHAENGYAVIVLSGEEWKPHDLSSLIERKGLLELTFTAVDSTAWTVRLVGDGTQSEPIPLLRFADATQERVHRYSIPINAFMLGKVPATAVVGLALTYVGKPGVFNLALTAANTRLAGTPETGYAIATLAALDPGARPIQSWLAVGDVSSRGPWYSNLFALRLTAGVIAFMAVTGPALVRQLILQKPVALVSAAMSGPILCALLPPVIHLFADERLEQLPLAMIFMTVGLVAWSRLSAGPRRRNIATPAGRVAGPQHAESRFMWMDALKALSILGVIGIHVTADSAGMPYAGFAPHERIVPAVLRALASGLNYPIFIIASFFLLAHTLESRSPGYLATVEDRLRRLMPPFLFWTLIYIFYRFLKASAFGYTEAYRRELSHGDSWLRYLLLGNAQYHLHFLPFLMGLVLCFPLFRPARRNPAWGLMLIPTLALWPLLDAWVYQHIASPEIRVYVLRLTKTAAFLGYGLFAFALYGMWRNGRMTAWHRPLLAGSLITAIACLVVLVNSGRTVAAAGTWLPNTPAVHMAYYLAPASIFALLFIFRSFPWPRWIGLLGGMSFSVYLVHPMFLDLLEILERGDGIAPVWTVAVNFTVVTLLAISAVLLLAKVPPLRWTIGLTGKSPT